MLRSPEESYISRLDENKLLLEEEIRKRSQEAEKAVMRFFDENFEGVVVRPATQKEDEGFPESKQIIDAVAYKEGKPVMGFQVTTAADRRLREKKWREMLDKPFIRLDEMKPSDHAIPRVLVYVPAAEIDKFMEDHDFSLHPDLALSILESAENSLKFHRLKNKNPQEIQSLEELVALLETKRRKIQEYKNRQA